MFNVDTKQAVTVILSEYKASQLHMNLLFDTTDTKLHITVHLFIWCNTENNKVICEDVSQSQKIHVKKDIFFPSEFSLQSTHPCCEANVFLSAFQAFSPSVTQNDPATQ